ncbi:TPA: hypothetical protein QCU24_006037 [Bacillus cereus]|uniref:hypothetical protein n=1 Tax=unclassified Bacillus cereus group TaxID=2750818 RepID=UPI0032FA27D7|nr:hypothetical protein [Bacillus cereus]
MDGKNKHIINLLEAVVHQPERIIQDTLCPIVTPDVIRNILKEMKKSKREYKERTYTKIHTSYQGHYRGVFFAILENLEFRSNNVTHQPIIEAVQLIRGYVNSGQRYLTIDESIPVQGVILSKWQDIIIETDSKGIQRVNQINYEIVVLQSLRTRLRCKEEYFQALNIPLDVEQFISNIMQTMKDRLTLLNQGFENKNNEKVKIITKSKKSWIQVTPLEK